MTLTYNKWVVNLAMSCYKKPPRSKEGNAVTCHLYIAGIGECLGSTVEDIEKLLTPYGQVKNIDLVQGKSYLFATFSTIEEASFARHELHTRHIPHLNRTLYVQHADIVTDFTNLAPTKVRSSLFDGESVPGLQLIQDFISEEHENCLLSDIDEIAAWDLSISRNVCHFGYTFNYANRNTDFDALTTPIPEGWLPLLRSMQQKFPESGDLNQITANRYAPGQGIAPHVDTHSAFGPAIFSLSLGSSITMDMRSPDGQHVPLWLPRRSLLIMTNASRYLWTHGIAGRKTDRIEGKNIECVSWRMTRTSLTCRSVLPQFTDCKCAYPECCDTKQMNDLRKDMMYTATERDHMHAVSDALAKNREFIEIQQVSMSSNFKKFIESVSPGSLIADIGCADLSYIMNIAHIRKDCYVLRYDSSIELLEASAKFQIQKSSVNCGGWAAVAGDSFTIPLRYNMFDTVVCVRLLQHFSTSSHRLYALMETARLVTTSGIMFIQVPATIEDIKCGENGLKQGRDEIKSGQYCHFFCEKELELLAGRIQGVKIISGGHGDGFWWLILRRTPHQVRRKGLI